MEGQILANRYLLAESIGSGGMGIVYRATDLRTGGTVAVKLLHPEYARDPAYTARLRREAQLAATLTSARVVRITDLAEHNGMPFLVMEYVPGETLADALRDRGRFPPDEARTIALEVAGALAAANARDIVHRDLKPENIKLTDGGAKVLDFGIARAEGASGVTSTGVYVGTPAYSAPERLEGAGDVRADIYALGVILYQMLEGRPPFSASTAMALLYQHANAAVPPLSDDVPASLQDVVMRCLEKNPDDRYQTPSELIAALAPGARTSWPGAVPAPAGRGPAADDTPTRTTAVATGDSASGRATVPAQSRPAAPAARPRRSRWLLPAAVLGACVLAGIVLAVVLINRGGGTLSGAGTGGESSRRLTGDGTITIDGPAMPVTITAANRPVRLAFQATKGQQVSLAATDVTMNGPCCMNLGIADSDGLILAGSGGLDENGDGFHSDPLPETGTYFAVVDPQQVTSGRLLLTLSADVTGQLSADGPAVPIELRRPGQQARLSFRASAGEWISVGLTDVAAGTESCCLEVDLVGPDGERHTDVSPSSGRSSALHAGPLADSGTYQVVVDPSSLNKASLKLRFSVDQTAGATVGGPPVPVRLEREGQRMHLRFEGTADQGIRIALTDVVTGRPDCCPVVTVLAPNGEKVEELSLESKGGQIEIPRLPASGTYTILLDPAEAQTLRRVLVTLRPLPVAGAVDLGEQHAPVSLWIKQPPPSTAVTPHLTPDT